MGAKTSNPFSDDSETLAQFDVVHVVPEANLTYLAHKKNGQEFLLREATYNDSREFNNALQKAKLRSAVNSTHLTNLIQTQTKTEDQLCSNFYKIWGLWEYPVRSLADEISTRALSNDRFPENDLWSILSSCILGLGTLQKAGISHECLTTKAITLDKQGMVKVADPLATSMNTNYETVYNKRSVKSVYLSPEQCQSIESQRPILNNNHYKQDVFTLGMILMECSLLEKQDECYLDDCSQVYWQKVQHNINRISQFYSNEYKTMLEIMLHNDVRQRLEWTELETYVYQNNRKKQEGDSASEVNINTSRYSSYNENQMKTKPVSRQSQMGFQSINARPFNLQSHIPPQIRQEPYQPEFQQTRQAKKYQAAFSSYQAQSLNQSQMAQMNFQQGPNHNQLSTVQTNQSLHQGTQQTPVFQSLQIDNVDNQYRPQLATGRFQSNQHQSMSFANNQSPMGLANQPPMGLASQQQIWQQPQMMPAKITQNIQQAPQRMSVQVPSPQAPVQFQSTPFQPPQFQSQLQPPLQPMQFHPPPPTQPPQSQIAFPAQKLVSSNSQGQFRTSIPYSGSPAMSGNSNFSTMQLNIPSNGSLFPAPGQFSPNSQHVHVRQVSSGYNHEAKMDPNSQIRTPTFQSQMSSNPSFDLKPVVLPQSPRGKNIINFNTAPPRAVQMGNEGQNKSAYSQYTHQVHATFQPPPAPMNFQNQGFSEYGLKQFPSNQSNFQSSSSGLTGVPSFSTKTLIIQNNENEEKIRKATLQHKSVEVGSTFEHKKENGEIIQQPNYTQLNERQDQADPIHEDHSLNHGQGQQFKNSQSNNYRSGPAMELSGFSRTRRDNAYAAATQEYVVEHFQQGSRYEGYKVNNMRHGEGKFYYLDGGLFDGNWFENKMHGYGCLYYQSGKLAYEGEWYNDQFHGKGKLHNEAPELLQNEFDYSNFDQIGDYWVYYEGYFNADNKGGEGKLIFSNGDYYIGNFEDDMVHGIGHFYSHNGGVFKGVWEENKLVEEVK